MQLDALSHDPAHLPCTASRQQRYLRAGVSAGAPASADDMLGCIQAWVLLLCLVLKRRACRYWFGRSRHPLCAWDILDGLRSAAVRLVDRSSCRYHLVDKEDRMDLASSRLCKTTSPAIGLRDPQGASSQDRICLVQIQVQNIPSQRKSWS